MRLHDNTAIYKGAGVVTEESHNSAALGLEIFTIPGGKYAKSKIDNWPGNIDRITAIFDEMTATHDADTSRPSVQFYRSQRELILLLPVK